LADAKAKLEAAQAELLTNGSDDSKVKAAELKVKAAELKVKELEHPTGNEPL
jgi:hypothetical protein